MSFIGKNKFQIIQNSLWGRHIPTPRRKSFRRAKSCKKRTKKALIWQHWTSELSVNYRWLTIIKDLKNSYAFETEKKKKKKIDTNRKSQNEMQWKRKRMKIIDGHDFAKLLSVMVFPVVSRIERVHYLTTVGKTLVRFNNREFWTVLSTSLIIFCISPSLLFFSFSFTGLSFSVAKWGCMCCLQGRCERHTKGLSVPVDQI